MDAEAPKPTSLREQAYRSGRYLVARQIVGMVVRVAGILAVTRLIGPGPYGQFAVAAGILAVLSTLAIFGIDVHLVRGEPTSDAEHTMFTLLAGSSIAIAATGVAVAPLIGDWVGDDAVTDPLRVMAALLPLAVLWVPARTRLERAMDFPRLSGIELAADVVAYACAIPLAVGGAGVWAPVAGFAARHVWLLAATLVVARYLPRPAWVPTEVRAALRFGSGYSVGRWVSIVNELVNPLLVGRLLGPTGVGQVALATRLVEQLGAVKQATMRVAIVALARLRSDTGRLREAHAEGTLVQTLGSTPLVVGAAFLGPWLIPAAFGSEWDDVPELLSLLAIAATIGSLFNLHASTLNVLGRNAQVARLRLAQFATLATATWALAPSLGVAGYGWARIGRTAPFVWIHRDVSRVFRPDYGPALRWALAFLPATASPWVPGWTRPLLLVPVVLMAITPRGRTDLRVLVERALGRPVLRSEST